MSLCHSVYNDNCTEHGIRDRDREQNLASRSTQHDVIHKTGSITKLSEEDRATITVEMH